VKDERLFQINWSEKLKQDCFQCGFDEFQELRNYTKRDIKAIDQLSVGETWKDPDYDLRWPGKKKKSLVRVRRLS
jgi:hypothetical protein